jgi:hypothetical protein
VFSNSANRSDPVGDSSYRDSILYPRLFFHCIPFGVVTRSTEISEFPSIMPASDIGFLLSPFILPSAVISEASTVGTGLACILYLSFFANGIPEIFTADDAISVLFSLPESLRPCADLPLFLVLHNVIHEKLKLLCEYRHFMPRLFPWVRIAVSAIAPLLRAVSLHVLCPICRFEFVRFRCDDSAIALSAMKLSRQKPTFSPPTQSISSSQKSHSPAMTPCSRSARAALLSNCRGGCGVSRRGSSRQSWKDRWDSRDAGCAR